MDTATTTSPKSSVEKLRIDLLEILGACPADQCNPDGCPLHRLREMDYPRRLEWRNALDEPDLEYLVAYHHTCMKIKLLAIESSS